MPYFSFHIIYAMAEVSLRNSYDHVSQSCHPLFAALIFLQRPHVHTDTLLNVSGGAGHFAVQQHSWFNWTSNCIIDAFDGNHSKDYSAIIHFWFIINDSIEGFSTFRDAAPLRHSHIPLQQGCDPLFASLIFLHSPHVHTDTLLNVTSSMIQGLKVVELEPESKPKKESLNPPTSLLTQPFLA